MKISKEARDHYCESLRTWSKFMIEKENGSDDADRRFTKAAQIFDIAISKSCLLDRMINCGEQPSQTPCPVHEGRWSGCHGPWPGAMWISVENGQKVERPAEPSEQCQKWYDAGCRCFQHGCGCTTGWQPDEHCGCKNV